MLTRLRRAVFLTALAASVPLGAQQPTAPPSPNVYLRQPGPGRPAEIMRAALAAPHRVIVPTDRRANLLRNDTVSTTVIVLGVGANVASRVHGSVIVIGGDLFLHPGAVIDGNAVAIGGAVYNSMLARVSGEMLSFRDRTYDRVTTPEGVALDYRPLGTQPVVRTVYLPLAYGFRIPQYDRVDGLVVPWGPRVSLDTGRITLDALAVYHSNIGAVWPELSARAQLSRRMWVDARAERTSASNDRWIMSDLVNSAASFFIGHDYRNYYRSDRARLRLGNDWETTRATSTSRMAVWVGAQAERARSLRGGGPWSILDRTDTTDGMLRPNPRVLHDRISSALVGADAEWTLQDVQLSLNGTFEAPFDTPAGLSFTQTTLDGGVTFPTFGVQSFALSAHAVMSTGAAPPQRYAYLGGGGTVPTLQLLELGGDRLVWLEGRYIVPITRLSLPLVGAPTFSFLDRIGSAGAGRLPSLVQNLGVRAALMPLQVDFWLDPVSRETHFALGVTLAR